MTHWVPARLHRAVLPLANVLRHCWRRWRKAPIAGVGVILTNTAGQVLLLRHSYGPPVWALPGGGIALDEEPAAGARREVHEELGLTLAELHLVAVIEDVISGSPHTAHLFAATITDQPRPDGREIIAARFFAVDQLPADLGRSAAARLVEWQGWRVLQQQ